MGSGRGASRRVQNVSSSSDNPGGRSDVEMTQLREAIEKRYPGMSLDIAMGREFQGDPTRPPMEQVAEYCSLRQQTRRDVWGVPSESTFTATREQASPYLAVVSEELDPASFPTSIAGVDIVLLRVGPPEPLSA